MNTTVIAHANCNDGSGAALAAWLHLGDKGVEYVFVQYGDSPPNDLEGKNIIIVDFSYPREQILTMATMVKKITIIDHHKTAIQDLADPFPDMWNRSPLCKVEVIFNMEKSGAVLAWEYFHDGEPPYLFQLIQDRDLWQFNYKETNDLAYGIRQYYPDFRCWKKLIDNDRELKKVLDQGHGVVLFLQTEAAKIAMAAKEIDFLGYHVPVVNISPFMASDTLHMLAEGYPFAVSYFDIPAENKRVYQLRSASDGLDVSAIAKKQGGGGHKHAAGFVEQLKSQCEVAHNESRGSSK